MRPLDFRIYANGLDLFPYQSLYFTSFDYGDLKPVFPAFQSEEVMLDDLRKKHVILVTGIASPQPLIDKLGKKTYNLYPLLFGDHHQFNKKDIETIKKQLNNINKEDKIIVTTEKDAVRFKTLETLLDDAIKSILYYIPVEVKFIKKSEKESFNKKIHNHVRSYQANK
jgi:tetraacyldisaccharide 4'-kinase